MALRFTRHRAANDRSIRQRKNGATDAAAAAAKQIEAET